jgi:hypothetical protein
MCELYALPALIYRRTILLTIMFRLTTVLILSALTVGLTFSAPAAAPSSNPTTHIQPGVRVPDSQLESTIRAKLAKSKIGKDGFKFKVARGVVTWEGSTMVGQHKGAATRMARTSGAVQVINNIQVAGGNKPGTPMKKALIQ